MVEYTKHLSEPWFTLIQLKKKTVEGRLCKDDFAAMKPGDFITFTNNDFGFERKIKVKVTRTTIYNTFRDYLEAENIEKCLPGIKDIDQGIQVYSKYFPNIRELENLHLVIAIRVRHVNDN